ncbi:MAG: cell wall hydrolase [Alphaproteobacteria bacterium]|jgi:spore germination cell wall hydrolase CwlJ-like protein|nr:cell wall hydrolase [Alphaproteobacteria bacterium]
MKNRPELILFVISFVVLVMLVIGVVQNMREADEPGAASETMLKETAEIAVSHLPDPPIIFNTDWIEALPSRPDLSEQELCLAEAIYFEARGESVRGQIAVAEVILNRARSARFPDTVCDVVYQGRHRRNACQFSYACDGAPERFDERDAYDRAQRLAAHLFDEGRAGLARGAEFYHAVTVQPSWAEKLHQVARIGEHVFLRHPESLATDKNRGE